VWVLGLHKSEAALEIAKKENSAILMEDDHGTKYQDFDPKDPDAYIGLAMRQNAHLDQSLKLANSIQTRFVKEAKRKNRGVKQAGFMVLYRTTMPSILVELGFLSYGPEEKYLASVEGQNQMATSLYNGFKEYKIKFDGINSSLEGDSLEPELKPEIVDVQAPKTPKDQVIFKVQIAASSMSIETTTENFKGITGVEQHQINGIFKYTVGNFLTFDEAKARQKDVRKKGFDAAFIIAFYNGKKITVQEGMQLEEGNSK